MGRMSGAVDAVCREPYRLFFPMGILAGTLGVGHWYLYSSGLRASYSGMFHSTVQILVYMNCFIIGFLLTALPRFTATPHARRSEVAWFVLIFLGILFAASHSWWIVAEALFIVLLLTLIRFVLIRIRQRSKPASGAKAGGPPRELIWIPFGILNGIIGTALHIMGQTIGPKWMLAVGKPMMDQGFLLAVVIGVGGFLIPRLMGTYEAAAAHSPDEGEACRAEKVQAAQPKTLGLHMAYAVALFVSFWVEGLGYASLGHGLRAAVVTAAFVTSRALPRLPKVNDFYVKMAYASVWLSAAGYWGAALFPDFQKEMLHVTFIGGFSLMTFAVATMVILTHAGGMDILRKPLWVLWTVALGLSVAVVERFIIVFLLDDYFKILGYSALWWVIVALIWLGFMGKYLLTVPEVDEFERMHQTAKDRLKKS